MASLMETTIQGGTRQQWEALATQQRALIQRTVQRYIPAAILCCCIALALVALGWTTHQLLGLFAGGVSLIIAILGIYRYIITIREVRVQITYTNNVLHRFDTLASSVNSK
jgi:preprotein translocase subunit SecY